MKFLKEGGSKGGGGGGVGLMIFNPRFPNSPHYSLKAPEASPSFPSYLPPIMNPCSLKQVAVIEVQGFRVCAEGSLFPSWG